MTTHIFQKASSRAREGIRIILLFLLISGPSASKGQTAVASAGFEASGSGGSASATVGQTAFRYQTGAGGSASDGVQQAYLDICLVQQIAVVTGWSLISSYIIADAPDFLDIVAGQESNIAIIKNYAGQVVVPSSNLNLIGDWNISEGYLIKGNNAFTLEIGCDQAAPEATPISLPAGWSIVSYLRDTPMNAVTALAGSASDILLVKDTNGRVYAPIYNFNQIGDLVPGQGYFIKMAQAASLTYPAND